MPIDHGPGEPFPVTDISLVRRAAVEDPSGQREALTHLLNLYCVHLKQIVAYRYSLRPDQCEDIVQGFVADKILDNEILRQYDLQRGKFRSWLLKAVENYVVERFRHAGAKKRSAEGLVYADAGEGWDRLPGAEVQPDILLELAWARQVCGRALRRMKRECESTGQWHVWEVYKVCELRPTLKKACKPAYAEVVRRFQLLSPSQAYTARVTALRKAARHFRQVIIEDYGFDEQDVEAELRDLRNIFAKSVSLSDIWIAAIRRPQKSPSRPPLSPESV